MGLELHKEGGLHRGFGYTDHMPGPACWLLEAAKLRVKFGFRVLSSWCVLCVCFFCFLEHCQRFIILSTKLAQAWSVCQMRARGPSSTDAVHHIFSEQ